MHRLAPRLVRHLRRLLRVAGAVRRAFARRRHRRSTRDARGARCAVRIYTTYYGSTYCGLTYYGGVRGFVRAGGAARGSRTLAQTCSRSPKPNQVRARRRRARPCRAAWNRSGAATGTAGAPPLTPPRWPPLTPPPRPPAWHWRAASPAGLQPQEGGAQEGGAGGDRRRGSGQGATRCGPRLQPEVVASIAVGNRRVSLGLVQFGNVHSLRGAN